MTTSKDVDALIFGVYFCLYLLEVVRRVLENAAHCVIGKWLSRDGNVFVVIN